MSFGGNALWALDWNGPSVLRIDPATGAVNATFLLPDRYASWRSIAAVGRALFVAGEHLDDGALLMLDMP
jgi:sugar lactone lactonase YvrE